MITALMFLRWMSEHKLCHKTFMFVSIINLLYVLWKSKIYILQFEQSLLVITESCVNLMFFVTWSLNLFWAILIDTSCWLFWAHFNRTCLSSALIWKCNGLHYWFEQVRKVTLSHFKAVTGPKINCSNSCLSLSSAWLLRENWSGWSKVENHQKASLQWIRSCWKTGVSVHSQVCFTSSWAERQPC